MGLGIVAYEGLEPGNGIMVSHDFFGRASDIDEGSYKQMGESFSFQVGSYSSYGSWRRHLCLAIHGVEPEELWDNAGNFIDKPFYELINFSDCEGQIGPKVSEELYQDFANPDNEKKFLDYIKGNLESEYLVDYHKRNWENFKRSFELARQGGLVSFC